jgi:hypothetical protein
MAESPGWIVQGYRGHGAVQRLTASGMEGGAAACACCVAVEVGGMRKVQMRSINRLGLTGLV